MTTCAEFLAGEHTRPEILEFLEEHLTAEEFASYNNDAIPDIALTSILKGKAEEIDKRIAEQKLRQEAEGAWDKKVQEGTWDDANIKVVRAKVKELETKVPSDTPRARVRGRSDGNSLSTTLCMSASRFRRLRQRRNGLFPKHLRRRNPRQLGVLVRRR